MAVNLSTIDNANDNHAVKTAYSAVRSGIIRLTPDSVQCKLYCRGVNCKYCSCKSWKSNQQAIRGIYSSCMNIRTIINMQTVGEHAFCGPALLPSGFTYDPEVLMENKIYFYNFNWPDFGVLGLELLLDVVKVMDFSINEGNVAVHCHAGLGRTGVVIASYLVWRYHLSADEAINYVRKKRSNSVQSPAQVELVKTFWSFLLNDARVIPTEGTLSLCDYLQLQEKVLCNSEARRYNHIPKVVHLIGAVLLESIFSQPDPSNMQSQCFTTALQPSKLHCVIGGGESSKYFGLERKVSTREIAQQMCSLLMQESDEQMDAELNASLASGIFNMVDAKVFIEEHMRGRTHFALYVLHRFMLSLKKPIASQHNIIRAFCTDGDAPVEAWQCLFYALLSLVSLLCYDNCTTAAQLLALWYTGEKANEVSAQIDSYLQKSIQPIKLVS